MYESHATTPSIANASNRLDDVTTRTDVGQHSRVAAASKRWQLWVVVLAAVLLVVGGVVGSILSAQSVVRNDTARSKRALATSAAEVGSTLRLAIQREQDLAVSATGFFLASPGARYITGQTLAVDGGFSIAG